MIRALCLCLLSLVWLTINTPADRLIISPGNADGLQPLATLGKGRVIDVQWSPDGDSLFVVTDRGIWYYQNPSQSPQLILAGEGIGLNLRINAPGNWLVAPTKDGIGWYDLETFAPVTVPYRSLPTFNYDGTLMAVDDRIVDLTSGQTVTIQVDGADELTINADHAVFNRDGTILAARLWCSACHQESIYFIDTQSGEILALLPVSESLFTDANRNNRLEAYAFGFSADGQTFILVVGSVNSPHTIYLSGGLDLVQWQVKTLIETGNTEPAAARNLMTQSDNLVRGIQFYPENQIVAVATSTSAGADPQILFYEPKTGELLHQVHSRNRVTFHPDYQQPVGITPEDDVLRLHALFDGETLLELAGYPENVNPFTPEHWQLLHPAADGALADWPQIHMLPEEVLPLVDGYSPAWVAFNNDLTRIARFAGDNKALDVVVQEITTGNELARFTTGMGLSDFTNIAFSQDGAYIVIDSCDRTYASSLPYQAEIWAWERAALAAALEGETSIYCRPLYNDDFSTIETLDNGEVVLWQPTATALAAHLYGDWSVFAYNVPGGVLAGGSLDGRLGLWDVATGEKVAEFSAHNDEIAWLAFNEDGTLLITAEPYNGTVYWWGVPGERQTEIPPELNPIPYWPDRIKPRSYQGIG